MRNLIRQARITRAKAERAIRVKRSGRAISVFKFFKAHHLHPLKCFFNTFCVQYSGSLLRLPDAAKPSVKMHFCQVGIWLALV